MSKSSVFFLASVFAFLSFNPVASFAKESEQIHIESNQTVKIVQMTFIDDEYEPEFLAVLDNNLRLICKWHDGLLFAGQSVGIEFIDEGFQLHLTKFGKDGEITGEMNLYRMGDDPRFYSSL